MQGISNYIRDIILQFEQPEPLHFAQDDISNTIKDTQQSLYSLINHD